MNLGQWRGAAVGLAIGMLGLSVAAIPALADGDASEVERAVIECGDSVSGHGGSADLPPECEDMETAEIDVPAPVLASDDATPGECHPRAYTREGVVVDTIGGVEVGRYAFTQTIMLDACPTSQAGESAVTYTDWQIKN